MHQMTPKWRCSKSIKSISVRSWSLFCPSTCLFVIVTFQDPQLERVSNEAMIFALISERRKSVQEKNLPSDLKLAYSFVTFPNSIDRIDIPVVQQCHSLAIIIVTKYDRNQFLIHLLKIFLTISHYLPTINKFQHLFYHKSKPPLDIASTLHQRRKTRQFYNSKISLVLPPLSNCVSFFTQHIQSIKSSK